jgi:hypothetical protein
MFDSLDEQIKADYFKENPRKERLGKLVAAAILSVILFGGLYFVVRALE